MIITTNGVYPDNLSFLPSWLTPEINDMMLKAELRPEEFAHVPLFNWPAEYKMKDWIFQNAMYLVNPPPSEFSLSPVYIFVQPRVNPIKDQYFIVYNKVLFDIFKDPNKYPLEVSEWYSIPRETILPFTKAPLF